MLLHSSLQPLLILVLSSFSASKPLPETTLASSPAGIETPNHLSLGGVNLYQDTQANLTAWPPVPFPIRIFNHIGARIQVFKTFAVGTREQTEEAQRLIAGEIHYLETHPATVGPKDLSVEAHFTSIWLGCHAWLNPRSRWTHAFAIDMLKSLEEWIKSRGFQEGIFDVTDENQAWLANCQILMHVPYPGSRLTVSDA